MDLVGVKLTNTDALSSIRGVYDGVGVPLFVSLMIRDVPKGIVFLSLLWGFYALSRILTVYAGGPLGTFGQQWLLIESVFCLIALVLLWANSKVSASSTTRASVAR